MGNIESTTTSASLLNVGDNGKYSNYRRHNLTCSTHIHHLSSSRSLSVSPQPPSRSLYNDGYVFHRRLAFRADSFAQRRLASFRSLNMNQSLMTVSSPPPSAAIRSLSRIRHGTTTSSSMRVRNATTAFDNLIGVKSSSSSTIVVPSDDDTMRLSVHQQLLIQRLWQLQSSSNDQVGTRILLRIFDIDPSIANRFGFDVAGSIDVIRSNVRFRNDASNITKALNTLVAHLDNINRLVIVELRALGRRYMQLGSLYTYRNWQLFAEALNDCAIQWNTLDVDYRCKREAINVWQSIVQFIIRQMQIGYEQPIKILS